MISIIVPCYNVGIYIEQCIWSLMAQKFKDLEIKPIDVGRSDSSLQILDRLDSEEREKAFEIIEPELIIQNDETMLMMDLHKSVFCQGALSQTYAHRLQLEYTKAASNGEPSPKNICLPCLCWDNFLCTAKKCC